MNAPEEYTGRMCVVCAWCDSLMGEKPCTPKMHGETSHGICPDCMRTQILHDIDAYSFAAADSVAVVSPLPSVV